MESLLPGQLPLRWGQRGGPRPSRKLSLVMATPAAEVLAAKAPCYLQLEQSIHR